MIAPDTHQPEEVETESWMERGRKMVLVSVGAGEVWSGVGTLVVARVLFPPPLLSEDDRLPWLSLYTYGPVSISSA